MDNYITGDISTLLPLVALWLVCAVATTYAAHLRGARAFKWFALGLLTGPIALLIALRMGKICPHCRQKIHLKARFCPHCRLPQTYKYLSNDFRPHPEGLVASGEESEA